MNKKRTKTSVRIQNRKLEPNGISAIPETLKLLAQKRIGGSVNFKGIYFQLLCAIHTILLRLENGGDPMSVVLEGVEDIDLYIQDSGELTQVKTSENKIDAGSLWTMNVFQHFFEVYKKTPSIRFSMVHNTELTKGKLEGFQTGIWSEETIEYWHKKFSQSGLLISKQELKEFFNRISFRSTTENDLMKQIKNVLIGTFAVNPGTEDSFFQALFYWVFDASQMRESINYTDLVNLLQTVKDSFSKFPRNPAILNKWINVISYEVNPDKMDLGYYDGKAARPVDIAMDLPVQRHYWEKAILDLIREVDVTVIKSSSGQGKSTLAWQAGLKLVSKSYSIYQLNQCTNYDEAAAINDFISGRLIVGQIPLIVIDGLSRSFEGWNELAKMLRNKPVKILITSREEDWVRYGDQMTSIILKELEIKLTMEEAGDIYREMLQTKKLHSSITAWEPIWEKVKDKGLMIEYIFLLTQGQMLAERLREQVSLINTETDGAIKLEILRLIAVADVLNIKLKTNKLTVDLQKRMTFTQDRNEVYRQLEKEYYLRFNNTNVEGLHPVRSEHLVKILHSFIPIEESLLNILRIIDEEYIYDFFINAPLVFEFEKGSSFYGKAALIVSEKTIPEMVYSLDGMMHLEPFLYWKINQSIFDSIFKKGGLDIFVTDTVPFNSLHTLEKFSRIMKNEIGSNVHFLYKEIKKLSPYSIQSSDLYEFVQHLKQAIEKRDPILRFEGVNFLYRWFHQLEISFPDLFNIQEDQLLNILETKDINESSEMFHFYSILDPRAYISFITANREKVIGWIKRKTNTLTIYESGNDIHINYLLDSNAEKANEYSVFRIQIMHAFFPSYEHYCTQAIILPFPNPDIYQTVLQNSIKRMPPSSLGDNFYIHINQIWTNTILQQYGASSAYEWQKQYLKFREHCLELYKKCTRLIEAHLEGNGSRVKSLINEVTSLMKTFSDMENSMQKYPVNSKKYFEVDPFKKQQNELDKWSDAFHKFLNQLGGLLNQENDQDRNLPLINIRSAAYQLAKMQSAFNLIEEDSYKYFPTEQLISGESKWLTRLLHTVQFYNARAKEQNPETVVVAERSVAEWKTGIDINKLAELYTIIKEFETVSKFKFYLPNKIIEKEILNFLVIGVQGCDMTKEEDLWNLSLGLHSLSGIDIHFFTFLSVDENHETTGGFRVSKNYFEHFTRSIEGSEIEDEAMDKVLPQFADEKMVETLPGITIKKAVSIKGYEPFFRMMMTIWKLMEFRKRLNLNSPQEKSWLDESEKQFQMNIRNDILLLKQLGSLIPPYDEIFIEKVLHGESVLNADEISQIMITIATQ